MSIRYKFVNLLTEGYNFSNADEVISAIKSNQVGAKIQPVFKSMATTEPSYLKGFFRDFFNRCENKGIKDTTYGVQLLLSRAQTVKLLADIMGSDGFFELLKSYKKPWVKQLPEYQNLMNCKGWSVELLHKFEKAAQEEQEKHGKKAKSDISGASTLYDDGTWKLMVPSSFEGEKAIAFYGKEGEQAKATHWCTRANIDYYNEYTKYGPLYVIRNMKTGKAYQVAFGPTEYDRSHIHFLDQDDVQGDEITEGDLTAIPDNLLKLIKDKRGGKTLYDFKHGLKKSTEEEPALKKGMVSSRNVAYSQFSGAKYGPEVQLSNGVCKKEVLNFSHDVSRIDNLQDFFNMEDGKYKRLPIKVGKTTKATIYYFKNKPESKQAFQVGWDGRLDGAILQQNFEKLSPEEQDILNKVAEDDFGYTKNYKKYNNKVTNVKNLAKDFNKAFDNKKKEIIEYLNNSGILKGTDFAKVLDIHHSNIDYGEGFSIKGYVLPKTLELKMRDGRQVQVYFAKNDHNGRQLADYTKANQIEIYDVDETSDAEIEATEKMGEDIMKIAREISKKIIVMPEYKKANQFRKEQDRGVIERQYYRTHGYGDRKGNHGENAQYLKQSGLSDKQIKRIKQDSFRKWSQENNQHPRLYEEVNYFPY